MTVVNLSGIEGIKTDKDGFILGNKHPNWHLLHSDCNRIVGFIDDVQTIGVGDRVECDKTHKQGKLEYFDFDYNQDGDVVGIDTIWVLFDGEKSPSPCTFCYQIEQPGDLAL